MQPNVPTSCTRPKSHFCGFCGARRKRRRPRPINEEDFEATELLKVAYLRHTPTSHTGRFAAHNANDMASQPRGLRRQLQKGVAPQPACRAACKGGCGETRAALSLATLLRISMRKVGWTAGFGSEITSVLNVCLQLFAMGVTHRKPHFRPSNCDEKRPSTSRSWPH